MIQTKKYCVVIVTLQRTSALSLLVGCVVSQKCGMSMNDYFGVGINDHKAFGFPTLVD